MVPCYIFIIKMDKWSVSGLIVNKKLKIENFKIADNNDFSKNVSRILQYCKTPIEFAFCLWSLWMHSDN